MHGGGIGERAAPQLRPIRSREPKVTIATSTSNGYATSDDFTSLHSFLVPQRCDVRGSTAVDSPLSFFATDRASDAKYQQKPTRCL